MLRAVLASCLIIGVLATPVWSRPSFGRNCSDCHNGGPTEVDALSIINYDGMVDPDESGTGAPDRGPLKFFEVIAGESVDLSILVDFEDLEEISYGVELKRMESMGVESGGTLIQSPDGNWFEQTGSQLPDPSRPYFTFPEEDGIDFTNPQSFTFAMLVDENTDPDFYDLEFALAGQPGFFYQDEHFYLHVVPEPATLLLLVTGAGLVRRRRGCSLR